jgi:hypothetical protein
MDSPPHIFTTSSSPITGCKTPPLVISPLPSPQPLPSDQPLLLPSSPLVFSQSLYHQYESIIATSLSNPFSNRNLRLPEQRKKSIPFGQLTEEEEIIWEKEKKKRERVFKGREEILISTLKEKMWEKLKVRERYEKKTHIELDVCGEDDAFIWSYLFQQTSNFQNYGPSLSPSPSPDLKHHSKQVIWKVQVLFPQQMGPWFLPLLKCYTSFHLAEVMFHTGVLGSPPVPLDVSLVHHIASSWKSSDVFHSSVLPDSVSFSQRFCLHLHFRISSKKIDYEE